MMILIGVAIAFAAIGVLAIAAVMAGGVTKRRIRAEMKASMREFTALDPAEQDRRLRELG